ncbi:MAG: S8 family serine peptidase [Acidimicrobiia bacterium]
MHAQIHARCRRLVLAGGLGLAILNTMAAPALAAAETTTTTTYVAVTRDESGAVQVERLVASSPRRLAAEVASLGAAADVLALEADHQVSALGSVSPLGFDPLRSDQWALDQVPFEAAWSATTGQGVVVAVVDSGVDAGLEDMAGTVLPGWDATTDSPGGTVDKVGHGTHVAGIIAARTGNNAGVSGAAPGVQILPVRVLGADGFGKMSDVTEGIVWAVDHGADVINLSLGGTGGGSVYRSVLGYARQKGVVVVAAAGNEAQRGNPVIYPGADPDVITVASVAPDGTRAPSSTWGDWVDLAAPGTTILSTCPPQAAQCPGARAYDPTLPPGYGYLSGTSMATPHVAAAAALVLSARPDLSPAAVQAVLESTARDLGVAGVDPEFGAGLIDPLAALGGPSTTPAPGAPGAPGDPAAPGGYWVMGRDGRVVPFGSAPDLGGVVAPAAPIVAAAATPSGQGYWLAGTDGGIFTFGDAAFYGSTGGIRLNSPIVGMAATTTGRGYWLLGADGGVFTFGDAAFFGSTGGLRLNQPIVDIAPTPTGGGYWLVATDGGVFAFGDAGFHGSLGGLTLNRPVTSLAPTAGGGYWMIGGDGGIFAFGDAAYLGSLPGLSAQANPPAGRRIRATTGGGGYYILGTDGRVFAFGAAAPHGSVPGLDAVDMVLAAG